MEENYELLAKVLNELQRQEVLSGLVPTEGGAQTDLRAIDPWKLGERVAARKPSHPDASSPDFWYSRGKGTWSF